MIEVLDDLTYQYLRNYVSVSYIRGIYINSIFSPCKEL